MLINTTNKCAMAVLLAISFGIISGILYENYHSIVSFADNIWMYIAPIVGNQYVSGIFCSFACIYIVYKYQLYRAKSALRKDFRCDEIMDGLRLAIDTYRDLINEMPEPAHKYRECTNKPFRPEWDQRNEYADPYCNEFQIHQKSYEIVYDIMVAENNKILIDSMRASLFLNVNPDALSIINNIRNRVPTLKERWKIATTFNKDDSAAKAAKIHGCIRDIDFLASYYEELLEYLRYDNKYQELVNECISDRYSIEEFASLPKAEKLKEIRIIRREVRYKYAIEHMQADTRIAFLGFLFMLAVIAFMLITYCDGVI